MGTAGRHAGSLDHGDLKDALNPTEEVESSGILCSMFDQGRQERLFLT